MGAPEAIKSHEFKYILVNEYQIKGKEDREAHMEMYYLRNGSKYLRNGSKYLKNLALYIQDRAL